jgi:hypothetical protein
MFFGKEHMKYNWNDKNIEILKQVYPIKSWDEIYIALGFNNRAAIQSKASKLGIKRNYKQDSPKALNKRSKFTEYEDKFIIDNYNLMTCREIAFHLNRSMNAIYGRVSKLPISKEYWGDDNIELLKKLYPHYSNNYLSEKYFVDKTPSAIRCMALKLGLYKSDNKGCKWYDDTEILNQLYNKSVEINRTPFSYELSELGLPSEITYRRYFGSYVKACLKANIEPNYFIFGKSSSMIASDGTPCLSKAEYVVTEYLISNGFKYIKEPFYKDYISDYRCGLKRFDWKVGNYYIEYFGLPEKEYYSERMNEKINICKDNDIKLICLYRKDLTKLENKLHILLQ